jgi:hypothetical protein
VEDIETGEARSLLIIGRDVCAAARKTRNTGEVAYLTVNGDRIAAVTPLPRKDAPVPCWYCNMLVSRDTQGSGIHATNPAIEDPWVCPANANDGLHLIHAEQETSRS